MIEPEGRTDPEGLATLVADGETVDWDRALDSAADEHERRILRHLRLVESVARVYLGSSASSDSLDETAPENTAPLLDSQGAPRTWGHLTLRRKLSEGAFGEVYRAWDRQLEREVALKLLKQERAGPADLETRILEEGRLLAKLRHPNVVTVFGAERRDGRVGLWMELVEGRTLEQLLEDQGPFAAREAMLVGIDLCRALSAVHRAGVVHRDIKATNAMREEGGRIVLMDFGAGIGADGTVAQAKSLSGTPFYMAPELFRGEAASEKSDIYALGVLLYRLVSRSFPVTADSLAELRDKHARREAKLLRDERSDLPEAFLKVVERSVAWDPDRRFATAGQMEQALSHALGVESVGEGTSPSRRTRTAVLLGVGGLVVAALVAGGILLRPAAKRPDAAGAATGSEPARAGDGGGSTGIAPALPAYTVEAALYRMPAGSRERQRLEPGARVALGDHLTLDFKASAPLWVYVIDEDELGHAYALFPLPGLDPQNPLPPGTAHVLPGSRDGKNLSWTVDTAGGREHFLVLASPTRLTEFETEMSALARPGQTAVPIPESAKVHLRGIGGLSEAPAPRDRKTAGRLFEMARELATSSEVVRGVWMRKIELVNPGRE